MQLSELTNILPELWLLAMSLLILVVDLFVSRWSKTIIYFFHYLEI